MNNREEKLIETTNLLRRMVNSPEKQVEIARILYDVDRQGLYAPKYENIIKYAEVELGYKRTMARLSIRVCERFMDKDGNWLIHNGDKWALTKLFELLPIQRINLINAAIDSGLITPEMSQKKLREIVRILEATND